MPTTLELSTAALTRALKQLEHPDRPSTIPPPAPVELTPERVAEIAAILRKSSPLLSILFVNGVMSFEIEAFSALAKKAVGK